MSTTPQPVGRDSRRLVLTPEAVEILDQALRIWWGDQDEIRATTGKRKILSRTKKAEKLGLDEKTVDRLYRRQPLTESVLRTAFNALKITPPFSKSQHCVVTPLFAGSLPPVAQSYIGRKADISRLKTLLESNRLVTLTGSGGIGKTRLAIHVAEKVQGYYPAGIWFVKLAGLPGGADPALIAQTIAMTLGVPEERDRPMLQTLSDFLVGKPLLLILDNCEHLLTGCAALVDQLLSTSTALRVMATSRERLNLSAELPFRVPSLAVPERVAEQNLEKSPENYDSVKLFVERAKVQRPDFMVTRLNAPILASLCRRLDGIPLAIELAAARIGAMPLDVLERRLDHCFRILTGGDRASPLRHQTLRSTIDWSYDLLEEKQKELLERLSVFADGCRLEAAEQVCAEHGIEEWEVLDLLTSLVEKNLVVFEEQEEQGRYRLLETIRQYAAEKLLEGGQRERFQERHQRFYLALAEEAEPHLKGTQQGEWLWRLETEHENLRAALNRSLLEPDSGAVLRFCGLLCLFWWRRGHLSEGRQWCAWALEKTSAAARVPERAQALSGAGSLAYLQGDYTAARTFYEQSILLLREIEDRSGLARSLIGLGNVISNQNDYVGALALYEQSRALCEEIGDRRGLAASLQGLGGVTFAQGEDVSALSWYQQAFIIFQEIGDRSNAANSLRSVGWGTFKQGQYAAAQPYFAESLAICRERGDRSGIAYSLRGLGDVAHAQGDSQTARPLYAESLTICREIGDRSGTAYALLNLGSVSEAQSDYRAAQSFYEQSLPLFQKIGSASIFALFLDALAGLNAKESKTERATVLWGAVDALRKQIGFALSPTEQEVYDDKVAKARQILGEEASSIAWVHGSSLSLDQAIAVAMGEPM
jgi:predicted ATPase